MTNLTKGFELDHKIQIILDFKNAEKYDQAIEFAENLTTDYPQNATVFGLLASLYFLINEYEKSCLNFKKTIAISPKSGVASLGLFHSLWNLGDKEDASNSRYAHNILILFQLLKHISQAFQEEC